MWTWFKKCNCPFRVWIILFGSVLSWPLALFELSVKPFLHAESSSCIKGCSLLTQTSLNTTWLFKRELLEDYCWQDTLRDFVGLRNYHQFFFLSLASHIPDGGVALGEALVSVSCAKPGLSTHSWLFWDKGEQSYLWRFGATEFCKDLLWDAEELECSSVAVI